MHHNRSLLPNVEVLLGVMGKTSTCSNKLLDTVIIFPRWEMKSLSEGYERAVDQNWDRMAKISIFGPKKHTLLYPHHVLATTGKSCSKK